MSRMNRGFLIIICAFLMVSCQGTKTNTLGDLVYKPEKEKKIEFENLTHKEVRAEYQELLDLFEDDNLKEQIERRIADVYMIEGNQKQIKSSKPKSYYLEAIKSYKEILKKYPNSPDNADVLYQLAKAYDMEGNQDEAMKMLYQLTARHPTYKYIAEAHFRKGDIYFNRQQYDNARREYTYVTRLGKEKLKFYAHYMLGWAHYKQNAFRKGVDSFAFVLNYLVEKSDNMESLSKAENTLIKDTTHSMSLALAKIGGASVIETIEALKGKEHIWMVYDDLGDYYLKKELFEDSAKTFRSYVDKYNYAAKAPDLHSKLINTYIVGGFPRKALEEKETYVKYYGLNSEYAKNAGGIKHVVKKQLKIYIDELAQHYHSQGQQLDKQLADKDPNKLIKDEKKREKIKEEAVVSYDRATHFYKQYLLTFPNDARVGEITFLKAEAHFLSYKYPLAISDYESVAYKYNTGSGEKYGSNAGYAAIISYQKHIETLAEESQQVKIWQAKAVESMLKFAAAYHKDKRSVSVLTNAAEYLFGLDQYERALQVSSELIKNNNELDRHLKKTAYGIMAHSQFKLKDFEGAEESYFNQRKLTEKKSKEYVAISERLASAIYKNSEVKLAEEDKDSAVKQLLKIKTMAPDSSVRVTAQYDAANLLLGLKKWEQAIKELEELIKIFPKHELAIEFPRKLAFAYEKNNNWKIAADTYLQLSQKDPDAEVRRSALFLSAELYEKSKSYNTAIKLFKRYTKTYEQPFDDRMEARYHLATLYENVADISRQLFWLRRIVDGDKNAGKQRTERSQWLAAWANIKYGDYFYGEFEKKKLRQPLAKYIPEKNTSLQGATERYQMAAEYGILEFVTKSSYKIASLYEIFAKELRETPFPPGLSEEERKVYKEIIEEQAVPFYDLAAELYQTNVERAWQGEFDEWIDKSFIAMRRMFPDRFNKSEVEVNYGDGIR